MQAQSHPYAEGFTQPYGITFDLKLPPLDGPQNQRLYFCTDHSAVDSVWYQYDQDGKLAGYSGFEAEYYGLLYKEFHLQYDDFGRLNYWEHLADATNNGEIYAWTYDSLGNITNLETFITSTQGTIPWERISRIESNTQYSVYQIIRSSLWTNSNSQILNDFYHRDSIFLIDFHLSGKVDSSYVLESLSDTPTYVYRYQYQENAGTAICSRKLYYKQRWYEGHWVVDASYEFYFFYIWYSNRYNYLPGSTKGAYFVVDSTWEVETPYRSTHYLYTERMGEFTLDSIAEKRNAFNQVEVKRKWYYNSQGQIIAHDAIESRFWQSFDYSHLINSSDTGSITAMTFNTRQLRLQFWSCKTGLSNSESQVSARLELYPNPSNGPLNVNLSDQLIGEQGTLYLYDAQGRLVISEKPRGNSHSFSTLGLEKGLYYLIFEGNSIRLTETWVHH